MARRRNARHRRAATPPILKRLNCGAELDVLEDQLVELAVPALAADTHTTTTDPRLMARLVINAIEGLTHRLVLRPPPGVTPDDLVREITQVVRAYVGIAR